MYFIPNSVNKAPKAATLVSGHTGNRRGTTLNY